MKKNMMRKEFHREVRKSLNRFFSIFLIVALGVAFFSGIRVAEPDMRRSADAVFDRANMMDIRVISTLGLTEDDLEAIRRIEGVENAVGDYYQDMMGLWNEQELNLQVLALQDEINKVELVSGRMPETSQECLIDNSVAGLMEIKVGDTITFQEEEGEETLAHSTYTITGLVNHPYFISVERGSSTVGDGLLDAFLMIPKDEFTQEVYTDILIRVSGSGELQCYSEEYDELVENVLERVEDIAEERCYIRYVDVLAEAGEELSEGRHELEDARAEVEEELADALKELEDGEKELADGEQEIADGEKELDDAEDTIARRRRQLNNSKKQLADGQKQLEDARKELEENREKIEQAKADLPEQEAQLIQSEQELTAAQAQWDAAKPMAEAQLAQQKAQLEQARMQVQMLEQQVAAGITSLEPQLTAAKEQLAQGEAALAEAENGLMATEGELAQGWYALNLGKEQLEQGKVEIAQGEIALKEGQKQIEENEKELEEARKQIRSGEAQLDDAEEEIAENRAELEDAKKDLEEAKIELADGWAEYEDGRKEAEEEIAEAEAELHDGELAMREIAVPDWYVLDRNTIQVYVEYDRDAENIGALGRVFPVLFFLVATLVSLTTMTRMVEEQRTQIGTLKALGYSKMSIAGKYVKYGMYACLGGSILGAVVGEKLLPWVIITTYQILYAGINIVVVPVDPYYAVTATAIACGCILAAILMSCYSELKDNPASLMRPEPPKQGKRILLERVTFIWKHLSFTSKSTVRNLFRYKKRFFMTVFGVGGCMALLIVGFGLQDSIFVVSDQQYNHLHIYDGTIAIDSNAEDEDKDALYELLANDVEVQSFLYSRQESLDMEANGITKAATVFVPEDAARLRDYVDLHTRIGQEPLELQDQGAVIAEKLADMLEVEVGDSIRIQSDENVWKEVEVTGITENYFMNYVYMSPEAYEYTFGSAAEYNGVLVDTPERNQELGSRLGEKWLENDAVASVTFVDVYQDKIGNTLNSIDTVIYVIIIAAGLLAFVVLYNLNNININERKRELATLKVLGFYDGEVASYVYRENILLTLIGIVVGVLMGNLLHRFVITTVEVDIMMFGRIIDVTSYLYGALLTIVFSLFVNGVMYFKLKKIDMVESLKSVE